MKKYSIFVRCSTLYYYFGKDSSVNKDHDPPFCSRVEKAWELWGESNDMEKALEIFNTASITRSPADVRLVKNLIEARPVKEAVK